MIKQIPFLIIKDLKTLNKRFLFLISCIIIISVLSTIIDFDATIQGKQITFFDDFHNSPGIKRAGAIIAPFNALLSILYVYLLTQGRGSSYIYGLLSSISYAYVAFSLDYIGEFIISLIYIPLFIYGYNRWCKNKSFNVEKIKEQKVKKLTPYKYFWLTLIIFILSICWFFIIPEISKAMIGYYAYQNSPGQWGIDAITNGLNLIGVGLMIYGYRNQYDIWLIVNLLSITMYIWIMINGQYFALSLIIVFFTYLVATIYGIRAWYWGNLEERLLQKVNQK